MDFLDGISGIIFDYGGTLDSRGDHWSEVLYQAWQHAGLEADKAAFRDCYVWAERELAAHRYVEPADDFRTLMLRKARLELLHWRRQGGSLPIDVTFDAAAETIADYCDAHARECIAEARPVLDALAERYPMVLVSNFYGNIDAVLRAYDLRGFFQGIIESSVVGVRKPDPRIFMFGVVALGLEPQQVLVVGDSLRKDILPAESIGCRTAWLKGKGWTAEEDAAQHPSQISSLSELITPLFAEK